MVFCFVFDFFSLSFSLFCFLHILAVVGDNCVFAGIIYQSGVTFQPNCQFQCTCQDGQVACVPRCDEDVLMPGPECPVPRKIKVPGECCEKWVCDSNETLPDFLTLPGENPGYVSLSTTRLVANKMRESGNLPWGKWS